MGLLRCADIIGVLAGCGRLMHDKVVKTSIFLLQSSWERILPSGFVTKVLVHFASTVNESEMERLSI